MGNSCQKDPYCRHVDSFEGRSMIQNRSKVQGSLEVLKSLKKPHKPLPSKTKKLPGMKESITKPRKNLPVKGTRKKYKPTPELQVEIGRSVAKIAENEELQNGVANRVKKLSMNSKCQEAIGDAIAESSDNLVVKTLARSKDIQKATVVAIANTIGNRELQKKAGKMIAKAAQDKRVHEGAKKVGKAVIKTAMDTKVQKKVAKGMLNVAKGSLKLGKWGAKIGYKATKSSVKLGYKAYQTSQQLKNTV